MQFRVCSDSHAWAVTARCVSWLSAAPLTAVFQQEELSEQQVRVGLIEKKLENANKEADERVDKIQRKLDEANLQFKKKEKYGQSSVSFTPPTPPLLYSAFKLSEELKAPPPPPHGLPSIPPVLLSC